MNFIIITESQYDDDFFIELIRALSISKQDISFLRFSARRGYGIGQINTRLINAIKQYKYIPDSCIIVSKDNDNHSIHESKHKHNLSDCRFCQLQKTANQFLQNFSTQLEVLIAIPVQMIES